MTLVSHLYWRARVNHITEAERDALIRVVTAEYLEPHELEQYWPPDPPEVPEHLRGLHQQREELRALIREYLALRCETWTDAQAEYLRKQGQTLFPYRSYWPWLEDEEQRLRDEGRVEEADALAAFIDAAMGKPT